MKWLREGAANLMEGCSSPVGRAIPPLWPNSFQVLPSSEPETTQAQISGSGLPFTVPSRSMRSISRRFFFITANEPIDVQQSLAALRALAQRPDSADAALELPAGLDQWSLRLKKPTHESP